MSKLVQSPAVRSAKREKNLWTVSAVAASLAPIGTVIGLNHENYFTGSTGVKVSTAVIVVLVMGLLFSKDKIKTDKGLVAVWVSVGVLWLVKSLIADLLLLDLTLAGGMSIYKGFEVLKLQPMQKLIEQEEQKANVKSGVEEGIAAAMAAMQSPAPPAEPDEKEVV